MHITRIGAKNVKGLDFESVVGPLTMIVGRNYSGKTSRFDAIKLALLGHIPTLGMQVSSTYEEAGEGTEMSAGVMFDNGKYTKRTWRKKGERVTQELDGEDFSELPPVLLNVQSYFDLSAEKRTQYVFASKKSAGTFDSSDLCAEIRRIQGSPHTKPKEAALWAIVDAVTESAKKNKAPAPDWLATLIDEHTKALQFAKQEATRLQKTVVGISSLSSDDITSLDAASVESSIAQTQEEITTVMSEYKARLASAERAEQGQVRQRELKAALMEAECVDRLVIEATLAISKLEPVVSGYTSISKKCYEEMSEQQRKVNDIRAKLAGLNKQVSTSEMNMLREQSQSELIDLNVKNAQNRLVELQGRLLSAEVSVCPTCGQISAEIGKKLSTEIANEIDKVTKTIEASLARSKALAESAAGFGKQMEEARKAAIETAELLEAEDNKLCSLKIDYDVQVAADKQNQDNMSQIDRLRQNLAKYERTRSKVDGWKQELESLQQLGDPASLRSEADKIRATTVPMYAKVDSLQATLKKIIAAKQDEYRRRQAIEEAEKAQAVAEMSKLALDKMKEYRDRLVEEGFKSILSLANLLIGDLLKSPLCYKDSDIGRWEGARFVTYRTFTGAEQAMAFSAISVALATESPFKLVLLDEMNRIDMANRVLLIQRIKKLLKEGHIDQFIGIDCEYNDAYSSDGVTLIRL